MMGCSSFKKAVSDISLFQSMAYLVDFLNINYGIGLTPWATEKKY
jgi:hypothetical protein